MPTLPPDPRVTVRDQALDAIIGHLLRRDSCQTIAELAQRLVGVIRANDSRIEESGVAAEVAAFAKLEMGPGDLKPEGPFRPFKIDFLLTIGYLRTAQAEGREAAWPATLREAWREALQQSAQLEDGHIAWVNRSRAIQGKAERLVFLKAEPRRARDPRRTRQASFENFRTQLQREPLRPHPWMRTDSNDVI